MTNKKLMQASVVQHKENAVSEHENQNAHHKTYSFCHSL